MKDSENANAEPLTEKQLSHNYYSACENFLAKFKNNENAHDEIVEVIACFDAYIANDYAHLKYYEHYCFIKQVIDVNPQFDISALRYIRESTLPLLKHAIAQGMRYLDTQTLDAIVIAQNPKFVTFRLTVDALFEICMKQHEIYELHAKAGILHREFKLAIHYFRLAHDSFYPLERLLQKLRTENSDFASVYQEVYTKILYKVIKTKIQKYKLLVNLDACELADDEKSNINILMVKLKLLFGELATLKRDFDKAGQKDTQFLTKIPKIDTPLAPSELISEGSRVYDFEAQEAILQSNKLIEQEMADALEKVARENAARELAVKEAEAQRHQKELLELLDREEAAKQRAAAKKQRKKSKKKKKSSSGEGNSHQKIMGELVPVPVEADPFSIGSADFNEHHQKIQLHQNAISTAYTAEDKVKKLTQILESLTYLIQCYAKHGRQKQLKKYLQLFLGTLKDLFHLRNLTSAEFKREMDGFVQAHVTPLLSLPLTEEIIEQLQSFNHLLDHQYLYINTDGLVKALPKPLKKLLDHLNQKHHTTLIVGGWCRDQIARQFHPDHPAAVTNIDIITTVDISKLKQHYTEATIIINHRPTCFVTLNKVKYKICQFDGDIEANLRGRDFRMNAIGFDAMCGEVYDPTAGIDDIAQRVITPLGDSETEQIQTLQKHAQHLLRAMTFKHRLGFSYSPLLEKNVLHTPHLLNTVNPDRLFYEWHKLLSEKSVHAIIDDLMAYGYWDMLFPHQASLPESNRVLLQHQILASCEHKSFAQQSGDIKAAIMIVLMLMPLISTLPVNGYKLNFSETILIPAFKRLNGRVNLQRRLLPHIEEIFMTLASAQTTSSAAEILRECKSLSARHSQAMN